MKKVLVLLTVAIAFFAFAVTAGANEVTCTNCKCPTAYIHCGTTSGQATTTCSDFDYESAINVSTGNCTAYGATTTCRAIFKVCDCDNAATNFKSGATIGFRFETLTTGVYFAETGADTVGTAYATTTNACKNVSGTNLKPLTGAWEYYKADATAGTIKSGSTSCTVAAANKVVKMNTADGTGYKIVSNSLGEYWWLDIPKMHIDSSEITAGADVKVRISLLSSAGGGICTDCAVVCYCDVTVGKLCCETAEGNTCMYFPYVLTGSSPWTTGIVITNRSSGISAASMEAVMTLTDSAGNSYTYTKSDFTSVVWSDNLDSILSKFSGTPVAGNAWLTIQCNFQCDGYSFLTNGVFGAGTLPRGCTSGIERW